MEVKILLPLWNSEEKVVDERRIDLEIENLIDRLLSEESQSETTSMSHGNILLSSSEKNNHLIRRKSKKGYRKPPFKIPFIPSIRILRRDIRRKYVEMFSHVMNAHDQSLYGSFLQEYFLPECSAAYSCKNPSTSETSLIQLKGIESMKYIYALGYYTKPDSILRITDARICKRLYETGSSIVANVTSEATVIYKLKNKNLTLEKLINGLNEGNALPLKDMNVFDPSEFHIEEEPISLAMKGTLTFFLDELHRFRRLDFDCVLIDNNKINGQPMEDMIIRSNGTVSHK